MARVTVEDCMEKITNRFELVIYSALRARQISSGSPPLVDRDNDKSPVIALREIAEAKFTIESLREGVIKSFMGDENSFDSEEEINQILAEEQEQHFEKSLLESSRKMEPSFSSLDSDTLEEDDEKEDSLSEEELGEDSEAFEEE